MPSKSLGNAVIRAFPGLFRILRMCAPRRAAAVVRPRGREKSADRRRRILISRLLIIRAAVPRRKSPFPAYFKGFPAISPLIPPYPAFLKYPVSPQPEIIADIITGNVEREETDPLLVQIIHSEFDADGIDYLMRDATFSGTSFGSFEIDQLIRCLTVGEFENKKILCIKPKGIAAADQYLINKFFSYSQVVFNKHIVISEWMAEYVIDWMQKHHAIFPNGKTLESWAKGSGQSEEYLNFTDNMFWAALSRILYDDLSDLVPHHIKTFCTYLLRHMEPDFLDEKRIITSDEAEAKSLLKSSEIVKNEAVRCQRIAILSKKRMTNQMPIEKFRALLQERNCEHEEATPADISYLPSPEASRLMECFSVKEADGSIHLLCDDDRSLMRQMYACTLVILREYQFPKDEA